MPTEPRIYLVSATPPPYGGVASWTAGFLAAAADRGWDVDLFETRMSADRTFGVAIRRLFRVTFGPVGSLLFGRARRAAVVHFCVGMGGGALRGTVAAIVARVAGKRTVIHVHSRFPARATVETLLVRAAAAAGIRVATPNRRDRIAYPFLEVIENFVPPAFGSGHRWSLAARPGLRLLYLGWLIHAKGLGELIRAVARVPGVTADLCGPAIRPGEAQALAGLIETERVADRVRIRDPIPYDRVAGLMTDYDALVLPSHDESFGMVVAEAMTVGLPVIATRVGLLEAVPDTAFVPIPVDDVAGLAEVLVTVRDTKAVALPAVGAQGFEHATRHFGATEALDAWHRLYTGTPS